MQDDECVRFLQWALPRMHMRWPGFRKVRKRVCKRLARRLAALDLADLEAYRHFLGQHADEWRHLDGLCQVVVTRFYRDKRVFAELTARVLPQLASQTRGADRGQLRAWSIGSASGEEAYTLAIIWQQILRERFPQLRLCTLGTEIDPGLIARARRACYAAGTLKNLPPDLRAPAFTETDDEYCLKQEYRADVEFREQDIRAQLPDESFDLILCRNLVFTYYAEDRQRQILDRILTRLRPGGWLVLGVHETLPDDRLELETVDRRLGLYRRAQVTK